MELLENIPVNSQIVYVNDASEDESLEVLRLLDADEVKVKILHFKRRIGLGPSILEGIRASEGGTLVIMDSDFTHDPREIPMLLRGLSSARLSIGSRYVTGGSMSPRKLYVASKIFSMFLRFLLRIKTHDIFGGFLAFRKSDFELFLNSGNFKGFGEYSARLCLFAEHNNFAVEEFPSNFRPRLNGARKSKRFTMAINYTKALIQYRIRLLLK